MSTTTPRAKRARGAKTEKDAASPSPERRRTSTARRRYRKPIERVKRPAETTTWGAGLIAALVSGLGLDGAGVGPTTWLTGVVGVVPFVVSASVDFLRERKEDRELRADLAERLVIALESVAAGARPDGEQMHDVSGENAMGVLQDLLIDVTDDTHKQGARSSAPPAKT